MKKSIRSYVAAVLALAVIVSGLGISGSNQANAAIATWQKAVSIQPRFAGDFGSASFRQSIDSLGGTGVNYVVLILPYYQSNVGSTDIGPGWNTPTNADLVSAIGYIHSKGLHVVLKPHLESYDGQWRAHINPGDRNTWFQNYGSMLNGLATLGQANGAEGIVIGTELISMSTYTSDGTNSAHWKTLIANVRKVYSGFLTYSANWGGGYFEDEKAHINFWSDLDYIGMSAYFNLNSSNSVQDLKGAWVGYDQNEIKSLSDTYGRPVIFTEIGYRSVNDTHYAPWDSTRGGSYDPTEQSNDYAALFDYWNGRSYLAGMYLWEWSSDANAGGQGDISYTPQRKPVLSVMAAWLGGSAGTTTGTSTGGTIGTSTSNPSTGSGQATATTTSGTGGTGTTTATTTDQTGTGTTTATSTSGTGDTGGSGNTAGNGSGGGSSGGGTILTNTMPSGAGFIMLPPFQRTVPQLSAQVLGASTTAFTRDLRFGMKGPDVKKLQTYLNEHGYIVTKKGAGSHGKETEYFGPSTWSALIKFQKSIDIKQGQGVFGSTTRAWILGH